MDRIDDVILLDYSLIFNQLETKNGTAVFNIFLKHWYFAGKLTTFDEIIKKFNLTEEEQILIKLKYGE